MHEPLRCNSRSGAGIVRKSGNRDKANARGGCAGKWLTKNLNVEPFSMPAECRALVSVGLLSASLKAMP